MRTDAIDPLSCRTLNLPSGRGGADTHLRRRVGPMAWTVLCGIDDHARRVDGELRAAVSIRTLAAELGLSKNAVNRAVRRLCDLGVIVGHGQARPSSGEYGTSHYVLALSGAVEPGRHQAQPTLHPPRALATELRQVEQLTLFPTS